MTGPSRSRSRPLICVVDDDESVLRSMRIVLSRLYAVHISSKPARAVEEIRELVPDVIVVDLKMPDFDGFWLFREVRRFNPTVPIIVNSAYQDILPPDDLQGAYKPFSYLSKSGTLNDFLAIVKKATQQAGW